MLEYLNELNGQVNSLINYMEMHNDIYSAMSGQKSKYTCFMGLGKIFFDELYVFQMSGYKIDFLCDNNPEKWGKIFCGYICISPAELARFGDDVSVIVNVSAFEEICHQLKEMGLKHVHPPYEWMRDDCAKFGDLGWLNDMRETIVKTLDVFSDDLSRKTYLGILRNKLSVSRADVNYSDFSISGDEYFQDDIFKLSNCERFVDAGAYVGDTLQQLLGKTSGKIGKAFLFELDPGNFSNLSKYLSALPSSLQMRIVAFNKGLWSEQGNVQYTGVGDGFTITNNVHSRVSNAEVVALDHVLNGEEISFIKMDIEGAEIEALEGSRLTIQAQRPKLAICTYHKFKDMLEIPLIIHNICPDYRLFLRHHGSFRYGSICYAVV